MAAVLPKTLRSGNVTLAKVLFDGCRFNIVPVLHNGVMTMNSGIDIDKTLKYALIVLTALAAVAIVVYILHDYPASTALIVIGGTLVYSFYQLSKMYASGVPARDYIPVKDREELIKIINKTQDHKEALEIFKQFISLYGFTGNITRFGVSGLPLLTVTMTIFFTLLAALIWFIDVYVTGGLTKETSATPVIIAFTDLAKLTLGAFIGSFVQRHISEPASQKSPPAGQGTH